MKAVTTKKVAVASIVFSITAICVIAVATAGSEGYRGVTQVSVPPRQVPNAPGTRGSAPVQDARRPEIEKTTKERNIGTARTRAAAPSPSPAGVAGEGKGEPPAPEKNEYEVLASEFLGNSAYNLGSGYPVAEADQSVPQEVKIAAERDRTEKEMSKVRADMFNKMNTVAGRLKLDQYQRELITQIAEQTLQQIRMIREAFVKSQMTASDKEAMHAQIRDMQRAAGESIRYALGDEKYKEFRKESNYYNNPEQRLYDMQKSIEAQKKQLDRVERSNQRRRRDSATGESPPQK